MRLNDRVRKKLADQLQDGEPIVATIALGNQIGTRGVSSDGSSRSSGSTALGTPYARELGIDLADRRHRSDLLSACCTLTNRRLLFHRTRQWTIRPTPGELITQMPREGVTLRYFDAGGFGVSNRVIHLDFPDGTRLLSATILKPSLRKQPYNDEPDRFVEAFGDDAVLVDVG